MSQDYLTRSKKYWKTASEFPLNKEEVYPAHSQVQEFDLHHGKCVLEYGCGSGSDTLSYLRRGNRVTALDIVPENITVVKKNAERAGFGDQILATILLQGSYPIPLQNETFDIVSSHGVLHHIVNPVPVVEEFYRILKPGGLVYVMLYTEHAARHFSAAIDQLVSTRGISMYESFGWTMDGEGTPYAKPYLEAEGYDLLESVGFKITKTTLFNNDFFRTYKGVRT